jgi:Glycosyl hydrolases family 16
MAIATTSLMAGEYFEGFETPGKPPARDGIRWGYNDELTPVTGWKEIIPGDGYASLSVRASSLQKELSKKNPYPFQTLSLGPVGSNHRISMRARNTAIPGVACSVFTYHEKSGVDEIDIEIVSRDTKSGEPGHPTGTNGGWTDIRLNTWADAREGKHGTLKPTRSIRQPIRDADGKSISHDDGKFHTYTIEWRPESVTFFIDGVQQGVIRDVVPDTPSTIIVGMRRMPWASTPEWTGTQTMLIDWIDIEPLE